VRLIKLSAVLFSVFTVIFLFVKDANALEGTAELRSTNGEDYRCFASSLQMQDRKYNVLLSCRDLVYPADGQLFSYILWATPTDDSSAVKLGELGLGKAHFKTNIPFSSLFATTEFDKKTNVPEGNVVMTGRLQGITFLDRPTTPTPKPEGEEEGKEVEITPPVQELSTRDKLVQGLRRAGIVSFFALAALIGLVFVITRAR
jgi:hypothetical protein